MVVEDEVLLLEAITKKLKLSQIDVLSCSSGQQAVDYLKSLDELPDAIWLDYYLKDMNGLAFMQELKQNPQWSNIPILVVSNSASPDKVSNMLALGARKYILKAEHRLDEIIVMIRDFIKDDGGESPAMEEAQAQEHAEGQPQPPAPPQDQGNGQQPDPTPPPAQPGATAQPEPEQPPESQASGLPKTS